MSFGENIKDIYMSEEQFDLISEFIKERFGLVFKKDKRLTLHARLAHRLSILGINSYTEYYNLLLNNPEEGFNLVSHIANNETYFFREKSQLTAFSELLVEIKRNKQKTNSNKLTILSAGCSSGEEPFTLNILLIESGLFAWGWQTEIIGIDISKTALKKAQKAQYTQNSFRMMNGDDGFIKKYFEFLDGKYILKRPYRHNINFKHGNILEPSCFEGLSNIDVIFSRNVLIYMSDEALEAIIRNYYNSLSDDGYLVLGSSESLLGRTDLFVPEQKNGVIFYRKNRA